MVRYNSNGSLDTSFDGDGKVSTDIGLGENVARAVALQDDDRIVVAGHSGPAEGDNDFALARYYS